MHKIHFYHSIRKLKTANKGGTNTQKGASPFASSCDRDDGNMVQDPIEETVSGEDALSHTGASPRTPFQFRVNSRLLSERWVYFEH